MVSPKSVLPTILTTLIEKWQWEIRNLCNHFQIQIRVFSNPFPITTFLYTFNNTYLISLQLLMYWSYQLFMAIYPSPNNTNTSYLTQNKVPAWGLQFFPCLHPDLPCHFGALVYSFGRVNILSFSLTQKSH